MDTVPLLRAPATETRVFRRFVVYFHLSRSSSNPQATLYLAKLQQRQINLVFIHHDKSKKKR